MNKSIKNYIILFFIMIISIIITIYILNLYKQYNDEKLSTSVISSVLSEIKYDDLDNVVKDRDFLIIYICSSKESECRNFERDFKEYVIKNDLSDDMAYLNIDSNSIINKIYINYKHEDLVKKLNDYPSLLIFSNGKIIDLISSNDTLVFEEFLRGYYD